MAVGGSEVAAPGSSVPQAVALGQEKRLGGLGICRIDQQVEVTVGAAGEVTVEGEGQGGAFAGEDEDIGLVKSGKEMGEGSSKLPVVNREGLGGLL
ncbi:hypothetical protein N836_13345 [Leptolyngbya sp. Heron Island J]|nr:hypothetical protein N836_13345 [Leptolyngbya sp. Heron Island J]